MVNILSIRQHLARLVAQSWHDPSATPEQAAIYRGRQFRAVLRQVPVAALASVMLMLMGLSWFWEVGSRALLMGIGLLLIGSAIACLWFCFHTEEQPRNSPMSVRSAWVCAAFMVWIALLWGILTVHLFSVSNDHTRVILIAVASALLSAGAWMHAVLPHAGLAWVFALCTTLAVGLGWTQGADFATLTMLILFYGLILSCSVLLTSRVFVQSLISEHELGRERELIGLLLNDFEENASDWLWEIDTSGRLRHVSVRLANSLGQTVQALHRQSLVHLLSRLAPRPQAMPDPSAPSLDTMLERGESFRDLVVPVMLQGRPRWWALTGRPLRSPTGVALGWRGVGADVTAIRQRDLELTRLAHDDALTGVANRHQLNQRLSRLFSAHGTATQCLLMILDLDNFKTVNDSLGHVAGDELLVQVTQRLKAQLSPGALLARLGGDEFAVLVEGRFNRNDGYQLGGQLMQAFVRPFNIEGHSVEMFASLGMAVAPEDGNTALDLFKASDIALYAAKGAGRGTLRHFEAEMALRARAKLAMLAELREALEQDQFVLHYQPQIDLTNGVLLGFEALVRWQHPTRGLLAPNSFIALAEDSGIIVPLGRWVLNQACRDAVSWPGALRVAVNVSGVEFARTDVRQSVLEALRNSGLPPGRLEVELTESTLVGEGDTTVQVMQALYDVGVRIALDDFGTGYSSLAYLRRFPLHQLKIDQTFVRALTEEPAGGQSRAIVEAILGLARALGLEALAEGVESQAQHRMLQELGCGAGQGYLFSRPVAVAQARAIAAHQAVADTSRLTVFG